MPEERREQVTRVAIEQGQRDNRRNSPITMGGGSLSWVARAG